MINIMLYTTIRGEEGIKMTQRPCSDNSAEGIYDFAGTLGSGKQAFCKEEDVIKYKKELVSACTVEVNEELVHILELKKKLVKMGEIL